MNSAEGAQTTPKFQTTEMKSAVPVNKKETAVL